MFRIPILGSSSGTWIVNYTNFKSTIMVQFKTTNILHVDTQILSTVLAFYK
jgi:hypothetical protein